MAAVSVQATDLLLVLQGLRRISPHLAGLTDAERAAADRLRSAADAAAASPGDG